MSNNKTLALLLAVSAVMAAGCTPKEKSEADTTAAAPAAAPAEAPAAAPAPVSLDGTSWVLASMPGKALADNSPATLTFEQGRAAGTDGCNRFIMSVAVSDSGIGFSPGPGTLMACPPGVDAQAQAFMLALTGAKTFSVADGKLTLLDGSGQELATFTEQRQGLAGTSWSATGINNGREALVSLVIDSSVTFDIAADGSVSGFGGCNNFRSSLEQQGSNVKFAPAAATRKMCPDAKVMEQEQAFFNALPNSTTASVDGGRLTLRDANGAMQVTAQQK